MPPKKQPKEPKEPKEPKANEKKETIKSKPTTKDKKQTKEPKEPKESKELELPKNLEFFCIRCKCKVKNVENLALTPDHRRYIAQCKKCNCNLSRFRSVKADS